MGIRVVITRKLGLEVGDVTCNLIHVADQRRVRSHVDGRPRCFPLLFLISLPFKFLDFFLICKALSFCPFCLLPLYFFQLAFGLFSFSGISSLPAFLLSQLIFFELLCVLKELNLPEFFSFLSHFLSFFLFLQVLLLDLV